LGYLWFEEEWGGLPLNLLILGSPKTCFTQYKWSFLSFICAGLSCKGWTVVGLVTSLTSFFGRQDSFLAGYCSLTDPYTGPWCMASFYDISFEFPVLNQLWFTGKCVTLVTIPPLSFASHRNPKQKTKNKSKNVVVQIFSQTAKCLFLNNFCDWGLSLFKTIMKFYIIFLTSFRFTWTVLNS